MSISFLQIPSRLRVPGVFIEQTSKLNAASARLSTVLHLGYSAGGNADLNRIYKVGSVPQARSLFGDGMLSAMAERHLKINKGLELYQVAVPAPSAQSPAMGSIEIKAAATESGILSVRIADELISVALSADKTVDQIAADLATAINATAFLPIEAEANAALVVLTATVPGLIGNEIPVMVGYNPEEKPPINVTVTAMHGGAGAPDLDDTFAAMGEDPYDYIVTPFTDTASLQALDEVIAERWHAMAAFNIQSLGFGVLAGEHTVVQAKGKTQNSEFISLMAVDGTPQPTWIWAAALVAAASDPLVNDPAAPITTVEIPSLKAPRKCWTWKQRNELLYSGISTFTSDRAGNVYIEKLITTYQKDPQGYDDASYLSIHVPELMRNIRRVQASLLAKAFRRYKLTDFPEQHAGGQLITSTTGIMAHLIGIYDKELIDARSWCTDKEHYKTTIRVERDPENRQRVNYHDEPVMIGQLEIIAGQSELQHG